MTVDREKLNTLADAATAAVADLSAAVRAVPAVVPVHDPRMEARLAAAIRRLYGPMTQSQWDAIKAALDGTEPGTATAVASTPDTGVRPAMKIGLARADFEWAMRELGCTYAQIRAVDEVESGGGWFTDVRGDILDLDGPGGFLDGPAMPKILFEAHYFDRLTKGKFRASHPNISSARWNKALYVGGQAEYRRLHVAMQLDRTAALKSASWGRYQIMGANHALAGFKTVETFVDAMKESERRHLEAFVAFIRNSKLGPALRKISNRHADCEDFARGYNGKANVPVYRVKIARAHAKYS